MLIKNRSALIVAIQIGNIEVVNRGIRKLFGKGNGGDCYEDIDRV
jgi:hypothetical protein